MDTISGNLYTVEEVERIIKQDPSLAERFKYVSTMPTQKQLNRRPPRIGRNEPCPCGSNRKFKHCCWTGK